MPDIIGRHLKTSGDDADLDGELFFFPISSLIVAMTFDRVRFIGRCILL